MTRPQPQLTSVGSGAVGVSQPIGTLVTSITPLAAGRYKVWGTVHHTLAGGVRLVATGQNNFIIRNVANTPISFGPIVMDLVTSANTVLLELQVATGGADIASGNLYVEKVNPS